jgi:hypothetical protein
MADSTEDHSRIIEIFDGTPWQAGMVKTLLEDAGIEAFIMDEIVGALAPWWAAPGGAGSVRVTISSDDYEQAKKIVEGYEENLKEE